MVRKAHGTCGQLLNGFEEEGCRRRGIEGRDPVEGDGVVPPLGDEEEAFPGEQKDRLDIARPIREPERESIDRRGCDAPEGIANLPEGNRLREPVKDRVGSAFPVVSGVGQVEAVPLPAGPDGQILPVNGQRSRKGNRGQKGPPGVDCEEDRVPTGVVVRP